MRWSIVLLLLVPTVAAQADVMQDEEGDVGLMVGDVTQSVPGGLQDGIDLQYLKVTETPTEFILHLGVKQLEQANDAVVADRVHDITFRHGGQQFLAYWNNFFLDGHYAALQRYDEGLGRYAFDRELTFSEDPEANEISLVIPRVALTDEQGAAPFPGRSLEDFRVVSQSPYIASRLVSLFPALVTGDESLVVMEDTMEGGSYAVQIGMEQIGDARLYAAEPFRFSNGEASTFVYWVDAGFAGTETTSFTLGTQNVPAGWSVGVPAGSFDMAPGQTLRFPVVVDTPFAHSHGNSESFIVEMRGPPHVGRVELGILYPEIPQPAGHHNVLKFWSRINTDDIIGGPLAPVHEPIHGNRGDELAYMNAAISNDADLEAAVDFEYGGGGIGIGGQRYWLEIPLEPSLKMGLDFQAGETGTITFDIETTVPMTQAVVSAQLEHVVGIREEFAPGAFVLDYQTMILATMPESTPFDLQPGQTKQVEAPLLLTPDADYVEYDPAAGLLLRISISDQTPGGGFYFAGINPVPRLAPGGSMELPLNEYQDPVDNLPQLTRGLSWTLATTEKPINAGETVVFEAVLSSAVEEDTFDVRLIGANHEWAELLGPTTVTLGLNESQEYIIAVAAPSNALPGDLADLVVEAVSRSDLSLRALAQVRATVVEEDVPDESALAVTPSEGKDSPAGTWVAILLISMAAAHAGRRRP